MSRDDIHDDREWPADEGPPSAEELEAARAFGDDVDAIVAGEPAAVADDLVRTSVAIHASTAEASLAPERRDAILGEALAAGARRRRGLGRRLVPVLAAAASVLLVVGALLLGLQGFDRARTPAVQPAPAAVLSRPSNDLLGRPIEDRGAASGRLDLVFADRLAGYRRVTLAGGKWR